MINALVVLLGFQLGGEVVVRFLGLPVPGPVLGAGALALALLWRGRVDTVLSGTAHGILRNLSLLFVPAAVGVIEHRDVFVRYGLPLIVTLIVSAILALTAAALVFRAVGRR
ncbi:CidA/LrgA family protein [Acuticoccus mangrovi]|uniref:CidA/LrgA family protein n=1 Tax=Acuticoccus mangrovi TaxID=2796142 RepID=A0A934IKL0_9HYPH|nr:CidA/LrgA family protein [Acuticoccus mangrovi]MBJ3778218.1 CidA/LrgA family protein [Acuticoccus mangrovi]